MKLYMDIQGLEGAMQDLADLEFEMPAAIARTANFVVQSTVLRTKARIRQGGRSGRIYDTASGTHQASAPGEAPANLSGRLAASYTFTKMTSRDGSVATAGSPLKKAKTLELGGIVQKSPRFGGGSTFIAPRPALGPSFEEAVAAARTKLKQELKK